MIRFQSPLPWLPGFEVKNTLKYLRWSIRQECRSTERSTADRWARVLRAGGRVLFGRQRYLVVWPGAPWAEEYILAKILAYLGVRPTNNPGRLATGRPIFLFKDATSFNLKLPDWVPAQQRVINGSVTDIRKSRVEEVFADVFGYTTFLNPLCYAGPAVEKPERNATHSGRVIQCPLSTRRVGFIYQRLIQNVDGEGCVVDLRVPVVDGTIPLVYVKRRPVEERFSNTNKTGELVSPEAVLSAAEMDLIVRFAKRFGLDFGELDVLRDTIDGRLYVVDVNNTPYGPPRVLSSAEVTRAVGIIAEAFRNAFM